MLRATMKIALAQIDTTVGAFADNAAAIVRQAREAADAGAQLVVFPELTLCGYPPKDLLVLREFVQRQLASLDQLAADPVFGRVPALVGFAEPHRGEGAGLFNACALLRDGKIAALARKSLLPTYDVFDEARYFDPSPEVTVVEVAGVRVGLSICEDLWNDKLFWQKPRYTRDPVEELARQGAQVLVNLSASPYALGKTQVRRDMAAAAPRNARRAVQPGGRERLARVRRPLAGGVRARRDPGRGARVRGAADLRRPLAEAFPRRRAAEHAPARAREAGPLVQDRPRAGAQAGPRGPGGRVRVRAGPLRRRLRRARRRADARDPRLRAQDRLPHRGARALRGRRLGAHGSARGTGAGTDERDGHRHAFALHAVDAQRGRHASRRAAGPPLRHHRHRADLPVVPTRPRTDLPRPQARRHRGEPASPHPRHAADGLLEQDRCAAALHREQERAGHRVLHPLR